MQAVILAAGRGKRLYPLTLSRSKAMLPVLGKPMLARILEAIAANNITNFVIVHRSTDQQITSFFSQYQQFGWQISFVEQVDPKGMAHALMQAEPLIQGDFLLSACDSLLSQEDYASLISAWHSLPKPSAILSLLPVKRESAGNTALVCLQDSWVRQIIEKPQPDQMISNLSSLPIYLLNRRIFPLLEQIQPSVRGELELQDAIQLLINQFGNVRGVSVSRRNNLTSAEDLLEINLHFLQHENPGIIKQSCQISDQVVLIPPYYIGSNTIIAEGCIIGPQVYIESDCSIAKNCRISEAVLLKGSLTEEGQAMQHEVIAPNWIERNHR
jgi:NDP-sugar pyrophosphorylase family protein